MIFVDANVLMYAVGQAGPRRDEVQARLASSQAVVGGEALATSAEVAQELLHRYVTNQRWAALDAALRVVDSQMTVWPVDFDDMLLARRLADRHPALTARDLMHLATCINHRATDLWTYDRGLEAAWRQRSPT